MVSSFKNKIFLAKRFIVLENFGIIHTRVINKIMKKWNKKNYHIMEVKGRFYLWNGKHDHYSFERTSLKYNEQYRSNLLKYFIRTL